MSQTDALMALFKRLDKPDHIVTVTELRDAAELLGIFPEHRFAKAFHQALTRLRASRILGPGGTDEELISRDE